MAGGRVPTACPRPCARIALASDKTEWPPVRRVPERDPIALFRRLQPTLGFAASLLAVWCQILLLATISLVPAAMADDPIANVPICHSHDRTQPAQPTPAQPPHNCALCALCLAHAAPLAILPPTPALPERQSVAATQPGAAHPRAPPLRPVAAAQPRGPPSLI